MAPSEATPSRTLEAEIAFLQTQAAAAASSPAQRSAAKPWNQAGLEAWTAAKPCKTRPGARPNLLSEDRSRRQTPKSGKATFDKKAGDATIDKDLRHLDSRDGVTKALKVDKEDVRFEAPPRFAKHASSSYANRAQPQAGSSNDKLDSVLADILYGRTVTNTESGRIKDNRRILRMHSGPRGGPELFVAGFQQEPAQEESPPGVVEVAKRVLLSNKPRPVASTVQLCSTRREKWFKQAESKINGQSLAQADEAVRRTPRSARSATCRSPSGEKPGGGDLFDTSERWTPRAADTKVDVHAAAGKAYPPNTTPNSARVPTAMDQTAWAMGSSQRPPPISFGGPLGTYISTKGTLAGRYTQPRSTDGPPPPSSSRRLLGLCAENLQEHERSQGGTPRSAVGSQRSASQRSQRSQRSQQSSQPDKERLRQSVTDQQRRASDEAVAASPAAGSAGRCAAGRPAAGSRASSVSSQGSRRGPGAANRASSENGDSVHSTSSAPKQRVDWKQVVEKAQREGACHRQRAHSADSWSMGQADDPSKQTPRRRLRNPGSMSSGALNSVKDLISPRTESLKPYRPIRRAAAAAGAPPPRRLPVGVLDRESQLRTPPDSPYRRVRSARGTPPSDQLSWPLGDQRSGGAGVFYTEG